MRGRHHILVIGFAFGAMGVGGCFRPDPKTMSSDNPDSSIPAIKEAADKNDRSALPKLVEDLNDNDPAVRFAAISALEKMTGQTLDYHYYDDYPTRAPALARWQKWLKDNGFPSATTEPNDRK
jgi:hypothetical protein